MLGVSMSCVSRVADHLTTSSNWTVTFVTFYEASSYLLLLCGRRVCAVCKMCVLSRRSAEVSPPPLWLILKVPFSRGQRSHHKNKGRLQVSFFLHWPHSMSIYTELCVCMCVFECVDMGQLKLSPCLCADVCVLCLGLSTQREGLCCVICVGRRPLPPCLLL